MRTRWYGRTVLNSWLALAGITPGLLFGATTGSNQTPPPQGRTGSQLGRAPAAPPVRLSPGLTDILRLLRAKVETPVVLAYIRNSPATYDPSSEELVVLKNYGASDEVLKALLEQGTERRAKLAQAARASAQAAGRLTPPYSPSPTYNGAASGYLPPNSYGLGYYPYYNNSWAPAYSFGPVGSFNNSYPTYVNGNRVYSGYYLAGYYFW